MSCNEQPHNFIGPLKDHVDTGVPQILLHWVVFEVTIATMQLQCLVDYLQEERKMGQDSDEDGTYYFFFSFKIIYEALFPFRIIKIKQNFL